MIARSLMGGAAAAVLLAAAVPACAAPPKGLPPQFSQIDVLGGFKAELAAGTLSKSDYDTLIAQAKQGASDASAAADRRRARSPLSDPNATQGAQQAYQDYLALGPNPAATAIVTFATTALQSTTHAYGMSLATESQLYADDLIHLSEQLVTARSHMAGADPAVAARQQQQLTTLQVGFDDTMSQSGAKVFDIGYMTPDEQKVAAARLQAQLDSGTLQVNPDGSLGPGPNAKPDAPPLPPPPWATSTAPPDDTPAPGPVVANSPPQRVTHPRDPNLPPTGVDQNSADFPMPPMPQQPQSQPQQPDQPPPPQQPRQPPPLDPVILVKQQPAGELPTEQWHYSPTDKDANGNPLLLYVTLSDGSTAYYGKDANGNAVPTLVVDAQGNYHKVDDQGHVSPDVLNFADDGYGNLNAQVTLPSLTVPKTGTLNAQQNGPGTNDHSTFQGYENGGMYTVANVQPIYAHWRYGPGNQGSIMQTPDLYPPGPSSVMTTPEMNVFGPSSVMWSLSSSDNLSGLSMNSGLRVGTPIGPDWSLPGSDIYVPSFDDITGPQFDDLLLCGR